jgi:hypothetical protein
MNRKRRVLVGIRTQIAALAILASPAIAADFRGSELGGPCSSISERERALGSKELGDPSLLDQHRFAGRVFDRGVSITYLCKDGALALGDYHFTLHVYDDAVSDFDASYAWLTATYGAAFIEYPSDQKNWNDIQFPRAGNEPRGYQASWRGPGFHASLALHATGDRAGPNWQVIVVVTP